MNKTLYEIITMGLGTQGFLTLGLGPTQPTSTPPAPSSASFMGQVFHPKTRKKLPDTFLNILINLLEIGMLH